MKSDHPLFFIAVLAPEAISEEVTAFKLHAAAQFGSARALRSPPHITLVPPFAWPASDVSLLVKEIGRAASSIPPFELTLRNFNCFAPRVIFVEVPDNPPLNRLQAYLAQHLEQTLHLPVKDDRPYHPHMTVAFKDLRRSQFTPAWAHFSRISYERTYSVTDVALLRHRNQQWEVFRRFMLNC